MNGRKDIFYSLAGQEDNLGDVVIRAEVARWLSHNDATVHVLVAGVAPDFVEAAHLSEAHVITNPSEFAALWARSCATRSIRALVLPPGPRDASRSRSANWSAGRQFLMASVTRSAGGKVISVGAAIYGDPASLASRLHRATARFSNHQSVRDRATRTLLANYARLEPDVAFARNLPSTANSTSRFLVISTRYDRTAIVPSDESLRTLVEISREWELEPIAVAQVRRDSPHLRVLADRWGISFLDWPQGRSHAEQLREIDAVYRDTAIVLTDRLHVAILAARHGATVVDMGEPRSTKLGRTLEGVVPVLTVTQARSLTRTDLDARRSPNWTAAMSAAARVEAERLRVVDLLR